ncbi:hypothetical protein QYE76_034189 [Lolium multiflorum]|uniref:DDE Tnp4 domain-containing protein n=1 Tax=Lolium multiflorum TaxID=4521 RepID=A0AAD8QX76_LOLMU|nr:hypothetical protein QYE76_034189 [Lolium multiflorum]
MHAQRLSAIDINADAEVEAATAVVIGGFDGMVATVAWRKDVECAFGVLKARFNILAVPGRSYSRRTLGLIMRACVILHNMIIHDERGTNLEHNYETVESNIGPAIHHHAPPSLAARIQMDNEMRDSPVYTQLQQDLIEHVWAHNA